MIEPVYVLENGQKIPYVPIEIKNHREAYAATLHVLFKHVADFHTCIVQTFSKKYGIPEDEIMQTIQESEEFKNMRVDQVLHHDTLGYISLPQQEHVPQQEPVPQQVIVPVPQQDSLPQPNETIAKKRIVKKKGPVITASEPTPEITAPAITAPAITASEPTTIVEKKKVIRKKVLPPPPTTTATTTATTTTTTTTALDRNDTPNPTPQLHPCDDLVQILTKEPMTPKKIIRKKS